MKKNIFTLCLFCFLPFISVGYCADEPEPYSFDITEKKYACSNSYEMESDNCYFGTVDRSKYRWNTFKKEKFNLIHPQYNLYNTCGEWEATGTVHLLSTGGLGICYTWGKDISIKDSCDHDIGFIDGELLSIEHAKFSISDYEKGGVVGVAYLDCDHTGFTVVDPCNDKRVIASYKREFVRDTVDCWHVDVYEPEAIDLRILKVFAAFAVDTQGDFKEDL